LSKYLPLVDFLKNLKVDRYKFHFEEIERIIGEKLPPAAYDQERWWSNKAVYLLMKEVLKAGWKQTKINFYKREVEFERANLTDFQKLKNYILNKMKPQANYQLVMIMTLVRMGGSLTKDNLAEQIKLKNHDNPDQDYKQIPVYDVLTENGIVRQEGNHYLLNGYYDFNDEQKQEIVKLCEQKIKEFENKHSKNKIAICWPTDTDDEKIDAFTDIIKQHGKALWGVNWNATRIQKSDFPIKGYLYYKRKIIAIAIINSITDASSTNPYELSLKPENVDYSNNRYSSYLHIFELKRCVPFPHTVLQLMDPNKEMPDVVQQRVYVRELQDEVSELAETDNTAKEFIDNQDFAKFLNAVPMISPFQSTTGRSPMLAENYQILYRILYGTALKLDDALNLKVRDLDLENREISVVGSEYDDYPATILPCDVPHLKQHIAKLKENDSLFKVDRANIWTYAKMIGIRAGLKISVKKGEITREGVWPSLFRESRARQMWLDEADDDLINLKLRKQFKNTEYKDSPPTIEKLKKWESEHYPFDYDELNLRPQQNVTGDKIIERKPVSEKIKIPTKEDLAKGVEIIQQELLIQTSVIHEIVTHLSSGRHVLLAGPVGAGKTKLAQMIPRVFWTEDCGYYADVYTATSDWSTNDVIGGLIPKTNPEHSEFPKYEIEYGCVTKTIKDNYDDKKNRHTSFHESEGITKEFHGTWLVIDEFNRSDIDKAFGQLFTALEYKTLKIPTTQSGESVEQIKIPEDYRIIGTLNTADKHFLFNLSDALKRRFAYVEIPIPSRDLKETEIALAIKNAISELKKNVMDASLDNVIEITDRIIYKKEELENKIRIVYDALDLIRIFKPLGTAILQSIYQTIIVSEKMEISESLDNALNANLIPQLESLEKTSLEFLYAIMSGNIVTFLTKTESPERYGTSFEAVLKYLDYRVEEFTNAFNKFQTGDFESIKQVFSDRLSSKLSQTKVQSLDGRFLHSIKELVYQSEII